MIVIIAILVALAGVLLIGIGFGRSAERARTQEAMSHLQEVHDAALDGLREQLAATQSIGRDLLAFRDAEIAELKAALEAEKRARVRDCTAPAAWGATDPPPAVTT